MELKAVKAVFAALEATVLASVHKKGLGSFTLPSLLKINVQNVPAKKKRTGVDPLHQAGARVRRQAGQREDPHPRAEEAEGRRALIAPLAGTAARAAAACPPWGAVTVRPMAYELHYWPGIQGRGRIHPAGA